MMILVGCIQMRVSAANFAGWSASKLQYLLLKQVEESGGMGTVHLCVMKLERQGEGGFEKASAVFAPDYRSEEHTSELQSQR